MTNFEKITATVETLGSILADFCWAMKDCEGCPLRVDCALNSTNPILFTTWLKSEAVENDEL